VLPWLERVPKQKANAAAAAIRALGLIGTPEALETLKGYRDEKRKAPLTELVRAAALFDDPAAVGEALLGHRGLTSLKLSGAGLTSVDCLASLDTLEVLDLSQNHELSDLSPLSSLPQLRSLALHIQTSLDAAESLSSLTGLTSLRVYGASGRSVEVPEQQIIDQIGALRRLETLDISSMGTFTDASALAGLSELASLELFYTNRVRGETLPALPSLKWLRLWRCEAIEDLDFLAGMQALEALILTNCPQLKDISALAQLPALKTLVLRNCGAVEDLSVLDQMPQLTDRTIS